MLRRSLRGSSSPKSSSPTQTKQKSKSLLSISDSHLVSWPAGPVRGAPCNSARKSKPALLQQLENFISDELAHFRQNVPCKHRLQVYRQALHMFGDSFPSYKSILLRIESEFGAVISDLEQEIENLKPMKRKLAMIQQEHAREMAALRHELRSDAAIAEVCY